MSAPDARLVVKAVRQLQQRSNHPQASKLLYTLYARELLTVAYRITDHLPLAEDLLQEVFLHSFRQVDQLREPARYGAWVKRMLINRCLREKNVSLRFAPLPQEDLVATPEDDEEWYRQVPFAVIDAAIQELPAGCRAVFTLHLLDGYKHREVAELLDIDVSTSKSQYRYALKRLRELLLPHRQQLH
ncbi:MAG: sigma-70 family RNA polymerase sigma factor [Bacteroidota bacterium]